EVPGGALPRERRDTHQAVAHPYGRCRVVPAEIYDGSESRVCEMVLQFVLRPAPHGKVIGRYGFACRSGERMPPCHAELMLARVELGHTAEGEGAAWRDHRVLKDRLLTLAGDCPLPVADIEEEHSTWTERPCKGKKDLLSTRRIEQVVQDPTAQEAIVVLSKR